ncbi:hypothetical protein HF313_22305 [Massilia atriviolacea]|uniref:Uncharacterized protein n=1 Tax=Massilia atriviolacea TaxID=2495579 RepID=A0A430HFU3_9BURK|nr:hypothetical protein [Massilia atriviolacea]RSZ56383.1 hypothetical protein EJB06_25015 [Massilia atriviolacea]
MAGISSVQQIVATIRAEMSSRVVKNDRRGPAVAEKRAPRAKPAQASARMTGLLQQRVAALDPADSQRGRKAFRIFLESVLLAEFGEELINDPAFYAMVDQVQLAMEDDPQIASAIAQAAQSLCGDGAKNY